MTYGYKNEFTKLSQLKAWAKHAGTKIVVSVGVEGPWVSVNKSDFFSQMSKGGDCFCDYDGEPVTVRTKGMVAYVGSNTETMEA